MASPAPRKPEDLTNDERDLLSRAHHRLRNASTALEGFTATKRTRGRWEPTPAPSEVLSGAYLELHAAYQELWRLQHELLGIDPPAGIELSPP